VFLYTGSFVVIIYFLDSRYTKATLRDLLFPHELMGIMALRNCIANYTVSIQDPNSDHHQLLSSLTLYISIFPVNDQKTHGFWWGSFYSIFSFMCMFCKPLFSFCPFSFGHCIFWPLYLLAIVSSNSSYKNKTKGICPFFFYRKYSLILHWLV